MTAILQKRSNRNLILILALALLLRLAGISSRPIWYDESFSALFAEQGPQAILEGTLAREADTSAAEEHPPVYYFILWGWMQIFGNSLISIRLLSVAASLGIITCIYHIAGRLAGESTAITASLLTAILPFQIHYGQEIRMYVFLAFWLCLAVYALINEKWGLFCISSALAQYTHNLAAFFLIPLAFIPVFQKDWKSLRSLTLAGLAAIALYLPWLTQLPAQFSKVTSGFWIEKPGLEKIFTLFLIYLPHLPLSKLQLLPGLLLATLTITLGAYQTYRARTTNEDLARSGLFFAYLAFVPPLFLWLVSQIFPVYLERALLPSHAFFCIWIAWAFTKTRLPRPVQIFTFILILLSAGIGFYQQITYNGFPYGPFASLDQSIRNRFQNGDMVIHSNKLTYLPTFYFDRNLPESFLMDPAGGTTDTLSPAIQKLLGLDQENNIEAASAHATRVWYVIFQESLDEYKAEGYLIHPDIAYLNENFTLTSSEKDGDIWLFLYTRPAR
ncbi:MAG: glycosyltransferase family 39 protein [Chloroflexi bacterium]|nr:glycosyltransferase family 39 protein [Chloroflexota bacterium]